MNKYSENNFSDHFQFTPETTKLLKSDPHFDEMRLIRPELAPSFVQHLEEQLSAKYSQKFADVHLTEETNAYLTKSTLTGNLEELSFTGNQDALNQETKWSSILKNHLSLPRMVVRGLSVVVLLAIVLIGFSVLWQNTNYNNDSAIPTSSVGSTITNLNYPGATKLKLSDEDLAVTGSPTKINPEGISVSISPDSPDKILTFYRQTLNSKGYDVNLTMPPGCDSEATNTLIACLSLTASYGKSSDKTIRIGVGNVKDWTAQIQSGASYNILTNLLKHLPNDVTLIVVIQLEGQL